MGFIIKSKKSEEDLSFPGYSWRPIVCLINAAMKRKGIDINTEKWQYNDNAGLNTQEECDRVANAVSEAIIEKKLLDDDEIYASYGGWRIYGKKGLLEKEIAEELNKKYPFGTLLYEGISLPDGRMVHSAHCIEVFRIKNFIKFLHRCGGVEIN
jgi:hypothetical protein